MRVTIGMEKTDAVLTTDLYTAEAAESRLKAQADVSAPDPETDEEAEAALAANEMKQGEGSGK
jgi:hypothetical protein